MAESPGATSRAYWSTTVPPLLEASTQTVYSPSGLYTYQAVATDSYGQIGSASSTINFVSIPTRDLHAPAVTVSTTGAGIALLSSTITVNTRITGGPGSIGSAQLLINGSWVGTSTTGVNGAFTFTFTPPTNGSYTLQGKSFTADTGIERDSSVTGWTVNAYAPPSVTVTEPTSTVTAGEAFAGATALEEESSSVTNINLDGDGTLAGSAANSTLTNWLYTNALSDGTHTIYSSTSDSYITGWSPPRHLDDLPRNSGCFSDATHNQVVP
jgi:hypothetical protein